MTRPAALALWRAAPLRLARTPGWGALVLVAATLLVASVVAPTMFVATARSAALADGLAAVAGGPYGDGSGDLRVTWDGVVGDIDPLLDPLAALPAYGDPVVTALGVGHSQADTPVAVANGRSAPAVMWYHDGALAALGADDAEGVWLPSATADALGLRVGDPLRIGMEQTFLGTSRTLRDTVLAGTYETAPGSALPTRLAGLPDADRWFLPHDPTNPAVVTPMAIVSRRRSTASHRRCARARCTSSTCGSTRTSPRTRRAPRSRTWPRTATRRSTAPRACSTSSPAPSPRPPRWT
ncbi:hypothetical protein GCM10009606_22460 [Nocardioides aquiterrae]|uniref:ABC transporter permease n=1 Tax=Nocardioides aquiterrae TaxID=203799 RepID=A0ABN1UDZ2_9ACTN